MAKLIRSKTPEVIAFALTRRYGSPQEYDTVRLPGWGWIILQDDEYNTLLDYIKRLLFQNLISVINLPDDCPDNIEDILDNILWQDSVKTKELLAPPASPLVGSRYLLYHDNLQGEWQGHTGEITEFKDVLGWTYVSPREGMRVWVEDENTEYVYNGTYWVPADEAQDGSTIAHSGNVIAIVATEVIPAFNVMTNEGTRATTTNPHHATRILGVTIEDAQPGFIVKCVRTGVIENPDWNWNPNAVIYLNGNQLSETPPVSGFVVKIGITLHVPTAMVVDISRGILL